MVTYFVRRMLGGFAQFLMASFIIFYIATELPPSSTKTIDCRICLPVPPSREFIQFIQFLEKSYHIDKPWPLNYVYWLFDPEDTTTLTYDPSGGPPVQHQKGVDITIGNLQIKGSGILTGDLGMSVNVDMGMPVIDLLGPGLDKVLAAFLALITTLVAIATAQRMGRPHPHRVSITPTAYSLEDWWHLHSTTAVESKG